MLDNQGQSRNLHTDLVQNKCGPVVPFESPHAVRVRESELARSPMSQRCSECGQCWRHGQIQGGLCRECRRLPSAPTTPVSFSASTPSQTQLVEQLLKKTRSLGHKISKLSFDWHGGSSLARVPFWDAKFLDLLERCTEAELVRAINREDAPDLLKRYLPDAACMQYAEYHVSALPNYVFFDTDCRNRIELLDVPEDASIGLRRDGINDAPQPEAELSRRVELFQKLRRCSLQSVDARARKYGGVGSSAAEYAAQARFVGGLRELPGRYLWAMLMHVARPTDTYSANVGGSTEFVSMALQVCQSVARTAVRSHMSLDVASRSSLERSPLAVGCEGAELSRV